MKFLKFSLKVPKIHHIFLFISIFFISIVHKCTFIEREERSEEERAEQRKMNSYVVFTVKVSVIVPQ